MQAPGIGCAPAYVGNPGPLNRPPHHRDSVVIGVDPGAHGALALIVGGTLVAVEDMPVITVKGGPDRLVFTKDGTPARRHSIRHRISAGLIANLLASWQEDWGGVDHVFLEQVHAHRDDSAASAFTFGRSTGEVVGVVSALRIPLTEVPPQRWKTRMGCDSDKKKSLARIRALFPNALRFFDRVKDEGRAEAALIGVYGSYILGE